MRPSLPLPASRCGSGRRTLLALAQTWFVPVDGRTGALVRVCSGPFRDRCTAAGRTMYGSRLVHAHCCLWHRERTPFAPERQHLPAALGAAPFDQRLLLQHAPVGLKTPVH